MNKKNDPTQKYLLIQTGGTLTMERSTKEGPLKPASSIKEIVNRFPELKEFGKIDTLTLFNIDSTNMRPSNWLTLASVIDNNKSRYNGIVIAHGTDTMVYTACAISFMIQNAGIPIIFTGSQLPAIHAASDARLNLINAFRVAELGLPETLIVFGTQILRGVRARKLSVFDLEAFVSVNDRKFGEIGLTIRIMGTPLKQKKYRYLPNICEKVFALRIFPGLPAGTLLTLVDQGLRGIFIEGYGSGNVPSGDYSIIPEIKEATQHGVAVVIGTQCLFGKVDLSAYDMGQQALDVGAIPSYDMTPEAAITKLMWSLGQKEKLESVKKLFLKDICGESEKLPYSK
jgi:L-asparaginase